MLLHAHVAGDLRVVAHHRQLAVQRGELRHRLGDEVVVGHAGDRQVQAVPLPDLAGVGAARVHHVLAHVVPLLGDHPPFAVVLRPDAGDPVAPHDDGAALPGAGGECEGGAGRVHVTVLGSPERRLDPVEAVEGMEHADRGRVQDLHRVSERRADAGGVAQPVELVAGVGDAQRAAVVKGERVAGLRFEAPVELDGVARHASEPVAGGGVGDLPGRMPGRAGGELSLLDQHAIRAAFADEVVGEGAFEDAPAHDDDAGVGGQCSIPGRPEGGGRSASAPARTTGRPGHTPARSLWRCDSFVFNGVQGSSGSLHADGERSRAPCTGEIDDVSPGWATRPREEHECQSSVRYGSIAAVKWSWGSFAASRRVRGLELRFADCEYREVPCH